MPQSRNVHLGYKLSGEENVRTSEGPARFPHDMFSVPGILVEVGCFYRVRMTIHQRGQAMANLNEDEEGVLR
jgi:hypothetical protein